ncbi:pyrroloquinoline quinone biosynthesis protein PqqB [Nitrobacter winogradskyi]|uniref:Pyrroloquinoline quinone biosynthesis protein B n=2 Tax=Nitrobacter winogradskyi TaxID=913 RepID=A0ACC6AM58_NITWI|nr:pyrroloquinoline quinone biosynthesis protein PqqB [Nitrobacter winogradskyi]MCP2000843.1 pyrroloquinoline quinone biosynthesis protein B [Nitrobacter winogradskyi]GEC17060.1 coenzyme PQQ synthesis protein B [Nitrobacter winogradskyi]
MRFVVLGAAAGGGLPQWNCGCQNCAMARSLGLRPQTQSSLAVSLDGLNWAILNASPDIRQQINDNAQLHPRGPRVTPIMSVVLTNGDLDHIVGLLTLRERQPFQIFLTGAIAGILDSNPVFRVLDLDTVQRKLVVLNKSFPLLPGLDASLFAVPGKVALFMEDEDATIGGESEHVTGVALSAGGLRAFYIPGCAHLTESLATRIRGADIVFFDGTLFTDDEMIRTRTGTKTGRRMGHMPISGEGGSLKVLAGLDIGRIVYIHINNTNPIWRDGPERDLVLRHGFEVGCDGAGISLAPRS